MLLMGVPDVETETTGAVIAIPKLLSYLITGDSNATILGLDAFPKELWPPINLTFYSYRIMLALAGFMLLLAIVALFLFRTNRWENPLFLRTLFLALPLGVVASEFGWMSAEVGRQPWVVYNLLLTSDAASFNVPAPQVLASILLFSVLYTILLIVYIYLLRKRLEQGPGEHMFVDKDGRGFDY